MVNNADRLERLLLYFPAPRVVVILGPVACALAGLFLYLEAVPGVLDRQERVRGRDFLNFFVLGQVLRENGSPLYDAERFLAVQESVATVTDLRPRYYPVYPPTTALFFAPLSTLPYETAIHLWWLVQLICLGIGLRWMLREAEPSDHWRLALLAALAAYYPVFSCLHNGQFAPVLLLFLWGGLELHRRGSGFWAGLVLAGLALKPQFALGPAVWLLLRRDWRACTGFAAGGLLQAALVCAASGPELLVAFLNNLSSCADMARRESTSPDHQHALGGIVANLLGADWADRGKVLHAGFALLALFLLWPKIRSGGRQEYGAVVLTTLALTPHLLTYDLVLLFPALAWLWHPTRGERQPDNVAIGGLLYLAGAAPPLYHFLGFSLIPVALLAGLYLPAREYSRTASTPCAGSGAA